MPQSRLKVKIKGQRLTPPGWEMGFLDFPTLTIGIGVVACASQLIIIKLQRSSGCDIGADI